MAGQDDLVPCAQGTPFNDLVGSKDRKTILLPGSGHIGLAIGGRAQREVWPQACDWLAERTPPPLEDCPAGAARRCVVAPAHVSQLTHHIAPGFLTHECLSEIARVTVENILKLKLANHSCRHDL